MTTSALALILAVLLLGGMIAALGDRLGTKVGKARLRLFKLRPRQTAVVVTIITGTLIAASTLGILFALSKNLRQGVFKIDEIRQQRREAQQELIRVTEEKAEVETELNIAKNEQEAIKNRLTELNENFEEAQIQLKLVSQQAKSLAQEVKSLQTEREELSQLREELKNQIQELTARINNQNNILATKQQEIKTLQQQKENLQQAISDRDQTISQLDTTIATKNEAIAIQETQLKDLEKQINLLQLNFQEAYQNYQDLREQKIAIVKGQILAFNLVQIIDPEGVKEAIDYLLREANKNAQKAFNPTEKPSTKRIVQITQGQVEQLAQQISDGQQYVIRILASGNYVAGDENVRVFIDVVLNQVIFEADEDLASVSLDAKDMDQDQLQGKIDWLLAASEFRARRSGILGDIQIEDGSLNILVNFVEEVTKLKQPPDAIKTTVGETAYTSGPLKLHLVAIVDNKVVISTEKLE